MEGKDDQRELEALLAFARSDARICPRPMEWQAFWKMLPNVRPMPRGWEPPAPLVLAGWWDSTNDEKAQRHELHIRWAAEHGAIEVAGAFLRGLPAEAWHHSDPTKSNY